MMIVRKKGFKSDPQTPDERRLESLRETLRKISKYGLSGLGSAEHRFEIADEITAIKKRLVDSGMYRVCDHDLPVFSDAG